MIGYAKEQHEQARPLAALPRLVSVASGLVTHHIMREPGVDLDLVLLVTCQGSMRGSTSQHQLASAHLRKTLYRPIC